MSVGELVDRYVGRYIGKSVPQNCNLQLETRLKPIGFKLGTLIAKRGWSLSLCRLVGHSRPFSPLLPTGEGGGLVIRKTSVPLWAHGCILLANRSMDSFCRIAWNSGLDIFHIQKTVHLMHWISFQGHLKKIFYSGGQQIEFDLNWSGTL